MTHRKLYSFGKGNSLAFIWASFKEKKRQKEKGGGMGLHFIYFIIFYRPVTFCTE